MVMGSLVRRTSGGLGDILSKIPGLGGGAPSPGGQGGGMGGGTARTGGMLPGPEGMQTPGRNPYGDLSDIIRRGGSAPGASAGSGGSPLWRMVRSVLGSALGFQSRGVMGWLLRVVLMRYGWRILTALLRRGLPVK